MANIKITTADDLRLFKGWVLAGRAHLNHRAWLFLFGSLQLLICRGIFCFGQGLKEAGCIVRERNPGQRPFGLRRLEHD